MKRDCEIIQANLLALRDGALDESAERETRAHVPECSECAEELAWLGQISEDLTAMGEALVADIADIDVRDAVMRALDTQPSEPHAIDLSTYRRRRFSWRFYGLGAAIAATLLFGVWIGMTMAPEPGAGPKVTVVEPDTTERPVLAVKPEVRSLERTERPEFRRVRETRTMLDLVVNPGIKVAPVDEEGEEPPPVETERGTKLRLAVLASQADRVKDKATEIMESLDSWMEARVGASRYVSGEDSEATLSAAAEKYPNDPHIRYRLAQTYSAMPEMSEEALSHLDALKELEESNALPYYMEAKILLDQGDTEGALTVLDNAIEYEHANAYAVASARYQEEALVASGLDRDEARIIAGLSAGTFEYGELQDLAWSLMDYGALYRPTSPETAQQLYEAVNRMGQQLQGDDNLLEENLAGAEIQTATFAPLEEILISQGDEAGLEALNAEVSVTNSRIAFVREVLSESVTVLLAPDADLGEKLGALLLGGFTLNAARQLTGF